LRKQSLGRIGLGGLTLLLLAACASLPPAQSERSTADAQALLEASAKAHGWAAYRKLKDINVSYDGQWFSLVKRLQPVLVDDQFRGSSEERMIPASRFIGQRHQGPGGVKQVSRSVSNVDVWYNGQHDSDNEKRAAAALVTEGYRLFLLGPMYLLERDAIVELSGSEIINGVDCDRLLARLRPGLGYAREDMVLMWIGKADRIARRVWFSLEGMVSTQGAIAEVEMFDHQNLGGVSWPTRFFERIHRPFKLDVHRWRLTGLDLDRGYSQEDIAGLVFTGAAARPATTLTAGSPSQ
jgi:hypothetical protein